MLQYERESEHIFVVYHVYPRCGTRYGCVCFSHVWKYHLKTSDGDPELSIWIHGARQYEGLSQ